MDGATRTKIQAHGAVHSQDEAREKGGARGSSKGGKANEGAAARLGGKHTEDGFFTEVFKT